MQVEEARPFLESNHRAVVATYRPDGVAQLSPVSIGVDAEGRAIVSSTESTAKVRNLRRDPRVVACVINDRFFGPWISMEGTVDIVSMPEALEPLVDYYRRLSGEHPDWEDYRAAMARDRRVLIRIDIERASG